MEKAPSLPQERYKMCNILCKPRNGWTVQSFCNANYSAICTQNWRLGHKQTKCVSPYAEFKEKVFLETATVVDSTVSTRGQESRPEVDSTTRSFCFKQCQTVLEREKEWRLEEVWDLCRNHLSM
ncbi:unnamed protein product [Durusdinium trenchii]|uniref:Uncharacterized protein n=1 Tax=Durusdinium trenchii TaxID=1381693 RepID=A0ABP0QBV4_9DINO